MTSFDSEITFYSVWCMAARYVVFALILAAAVLVVVLLKKRRIKNITALISAAVLVVAIVFMFAGGTTHRPGFSVAGIDDFCRDIRSQLTDDRLQINESETGKTQRSWKWSVDNESVYARIYVQDSSFPRQIEVNKNIGLYDSPKAVYGRTDSAEYLFSPLWRTDYKKYLFLKTDYTGEFIIETKDYTVSVVYEMKNIESNRYLSAVFPVFPKNQYELSLLYGH